MENDNQLLHEIASEFGDETTGMKSNNFWLRRILKKIKSPSSGSGSSDLSDYIKKSDVSTEEITFTYEDDSTDTLVFLVDNSESEGD